MAEASLVEMSDVRKYYMLGETRVDALRGVSFTIDKGEFLAIAGPSGSGKSTILNMIGCIDNPSDGKVLIDGTGRSSISRTRSSLAIGARVLGSSFSPSPLQPSTSMKTSSSRFFSPTTARARSVRKS